MALILNGSPNENGYSMTLARALFDLDEGTRYNAYDLDVTSCDDCKVCSHKPTCKYNDDDLSLILKALAREKTLILISPVYFGAFSDKLLSIINRFQQLFDRKHKHGDPLTNIDTLYVVATSGADNPRMAEGIRLTTDILKSLFETKTTDIFFFPGTDGVKDAPTRFKDELETMKKRIKKH